MNKQTDFRNVFKSLNTEHEYTHLPVVGNIPHWLEGRFISVGPAKFEIGKQKLKHWFDGFAMLKSFTFQNGNVDFCNRFLKSKQYQRSHKLDRLAFDEFGTLAQHSFIDLFLQPIKTFLNKITFDNCNVNTCVINGVHIAMTETPEHISFTPNHLETLQTLHYQDKLNPSLSSAHPHYCQRLQQFISIATTFGKTTKYQAYTIGNNLNREVLATYESQEAFYMHSFSITDKDIILIQSPLEFSLSKVFNPKLTINQALEWHNNKPSKFIIIDRESSSTKIIEVDPFICLHSANAYREQDKIWIDLCCYDHGNIYNSFYFDYIMSNNFITPQAYLRKYCIDLTARTASFEKISDFPFEFPRYNYSHFNTKPYQYLYGTKVAEQPNEFLTGLVKFDVNTGSMKLWKESALLPGEPIFVAHPNASTEDHGVVMTICYDTSSNTSGLIILDGRTMQEQARIALPIHLPNGLHGNFYSL